MNLTLTKAQSQNVACWDTMCSIPTGVLVQVLKSVKAVWTEM